MQEYGESRGCGWVTAMNRFFCFYRQLLLVFHLEQNICRHFQNQIMNLLSSKSSGDRGTLTIIPAKIKRFDEIKWVEIEKNDVIKIWVDKNRYDVHCNTLVNQIINCTASLLSVCLSVKLGLNPVGRLPQMGSLPVDAQRWVNKKTREEGLNRLCVWNIKHSDKPLTVCQNKASRGHRNESSLSSLEALLGNWYCLIWSHFDTNTCRHLTR